MGNAIRQAAGLCDRLVVSIHSDAEIALNKGPPVLVQHERYSLLRHVKWVGDIAEDVPYAPSIKILDRVGAHFCVHGDDMPVGVDGVGAYDELRDAGRLEIVARTEGVSTTDFIGRLLSLSKEHHERRTSENGSVSPVKRNSVRGAAVPGEGTLQQQGIRLLASTRRLAEFAKPQRAP